MRLAILWFVLLALPVVGASQTSWPCDSVTINCCSINVYSPNSISIQVYNNSVSNLFAYPGFILFDQNADTVALETVNYYGIGPYFQVHTLVLKK